MKTKAKWTFAAYLAGDNSLSSAGPRDLAEMRRVGSSRDVNIVVQFDRGGSTRATQRYQIQKYGSNELVQSLGTTDCGDPAVLLKFIRWTAKKFPAEHYALILWNHGGGWEPSEIDRIARKVKAVSYGRAEGSQRTRSTLGRALFRPTLENVMRQPTVDLRAICEDDGTGHSLDTVELGKVLAEAVTLFGQPIDLLGMDACLMSNLEVAYQAQPYVRYAVASEESEPNDGWPYDRVLRPLVKNPDMAPADLAGLIVQAYLESYEPRSSTWPVTQTALDLSKVPDLMAPLDKLSDALNAAMPGAQADVNRAQFDCIPFWDGTLFDVAEFCAGLQAWLTDPARPGPQPADAAVLQASRDVRSALQAGTGRFVMAEGYHGDDLAHCAGLSLYLPERRKRMRISPYYADLEFAKQHRWLAMLKAYHQ
jgi:Clostripain family